MFRFSLSWLQLPTAHLAGHIAETSLFWFLHFWGRDNTLYLSRTARNLTDNCQPFFPLAWVLKFPCTLGAGYSLNKTITSHGNAWKKCIRHEKHSLYSEAFSQRLLSFTGPWVVQLNFLTEQLGVLIYRCPRSWVVEKRGEQGPGDLQGSPGNTFPRRCYGLRPGRSITIPGRATSTWGVVRSALSSS